MAKSIDVLHDSCPQCGGDLVLAGVSSHSWRGKPRARYSHFCHTCGYATLISVANITSDTNDLNALVRLRDFLAKERARITRLNIRRMVMRGNENSRE